MQKRNGVKTQQNGVKTQQNGVKKMTCFFEVIMQSELDSLMEKDTPLPVLRSTDRKEPHIPFRVGIVKFGNLLLVVCECTLSLQVPTGPWP